ncbi:Smr/MutS family protein [Pseudoprimorskyibacter insulae]|uniref:Endonuclease MutS2 n=1 Tax=Pseudoprimorskyibacter insulae TaxID=1695997 RepID=A0A2R8ATR4_9RHOB|nr:Smr/MutS family protein [Pseudoprimorskyibacter insulae]SPF79436.1 Endonuclease MutS2 [Pseudoprimorskyibacter insulae]
MSRRRLRKEDLELWELVAKSTDRLQRRSPLAKRDPDEMPTQFEAPAADPAPLPRFRVGQVAKPKPESTAMPQTVSQQLATSGVHMDKKAFGRMRRGKLVPEARIDLHGMTLDQAHPVLNRFILTSHMRGFRLVLVITGKGQRDDPHDPMPLRRGVLKRQVPQWLRLSPLTHVVLQVTEAHIKHGGAGAYYVYLRRGR